MKACIARRVKAEEFPDKPLAEKCWTHNLEQLFRVAGLRDAFEAALQADPELSANWDDVKEWTEASRYARRTKAEAGRLCNAITAKQHGVFSWVKRYW
ncbi:MAG TPA: hypothetical protein VEL76_27190 [Gemmataceae bacterium]|nr:hypothetical protein [Gemmataceae bacterium]